MISPSYESDDEHSQHNYLDLYEKDAQCQSTFIELVLDAFVYKHLAHNHQYQ